MQIRIQEFVISENGQKLTLDKLPVEHSLN